MPLYEFSCGTHDFEAIRKPSEYLTDIPCRVDGCTLTAKRVMYSLYGSGQSSTLPSEPTVIFKGAEGKVLYPGHSQEKAPAGFERVELRTTAEKRSFVKEMNFSERMDFEQRETARQANFEQVQSENRAQLFHDSQGWDERGRAFMRAAIAKTNRSKSRRSAPTFMLPTLEYDASNRMPHRDEETSWRPKK